MEKSTTKELYENRQKRELVQVATTAADTIAAAADTTTIADKTSTAAGMTAAASTTAATDTTAAAYHGAFSPGGVD